MEEKFVEEDSDPTESSTARAAMAQQEHESIVADLARTDHNWVALAQRIRKFTKAKLFGLIVNPDNGKPFTRAADWVQHVTGKCRSAFYRDEKILRELGGIVSDSKLAKMSRENAKQLAKRAKQGKEIDERLVDEAVEESAAEFHETSSQAEAGDSGAPLEDIGVKKTFVLTEADRKMVVKAMNKVKKTLPAMNRNLREGAALGKIASFYLEHCGMVLPEPQPVTSKLPKSSLSVM